MIEKFENGAWDERPAYFLFQNRQTIVLSIGLGFNIYYGALIRKQKLENHETQGEMENQNLEEKTHPQRRVSFGIKIPSSTKPTLSFLLRPQIPNQIIHSFPFFQTLTFLSLPNPTIPHALVQSTQFLESSVIDFVLSWFFVSSIGPFNGEGRRFRRVRCAF